MSRRFWTEEKIISEIQKLHDNGENLWYRAMERNHKDLIRASERYFAGWKNAVIAAGLDYNTIKKRSHQVWTKDIILEKIYELRNQGVVLKPSKVQKQDKKLYHAALRQFQNFNNVLEKLNKKYKLEPAEITLRQPKTKMTRSSTQVTRSKPRVKAKDPTGRDKKDTATNMKIFTVRTRVRSERNVGEAIEKRANTKDVNIGSIQYPTILNGYIFVECNDRQELNRLIKNIKNAQGLLNGETTTQEISGYLNTTKNKKSIIEGARIVITEGQFKGEEAIIQHINDRTKNITVELQNEVLKMPVVIKKDHCKILS